MKEGKNILWQILQRINKFTFIVTVNIFAAVMIFWRSQVYLVAKFLKNIQQLEVLGSSGPQLIAGGPHQQLPKKPQNPPKKIHKIVDTEKTW